MALKKIKTKNFIDKYKTEYVKLSPVFSKAIGDTVYFNMSGFKHLIFKGRRRRENAAIFNRLVLVPLIAPVIHNCSKEKEIRVREEMINNKIIRVTYYSLEARVGRDRVRVRVVTRKLGSLGKHYFQSVMRY